ncbi:MAG TPA: hypothetical protein VEC18_07725 [Myxococcota bacterium]|nr:hypothetical protein [Myxococcota bacterium]
MELDAYRITWIVAGLIVVIGWLIASFAPPSPRRVVVEWLATSAMYAAILAIFVHLTVRAHASGWVFAAWALGFLCAMFACGLLVSAWKMLAALGGEKKGDGSATH